MAVREESKITPARRRRASGRQPESARVSGYAAATGQPAAAAAHREQHVPAGEGPAAPPPSVWEPARQAPWTERRAPARMLRLGRLWPLPAVLGLLLLAGGGYGAVGLWARLSTAVVAGSGLALQVRAGETLSQMVRRWTDRELLQSPRALLWLARLRGQSRRIKAGVYEFQGHISTGALLDALVQGVESRLAVTIPEGFTLRQIAARLENQRVLAAKPFLRLSRDARFIASLNLPLATQPKTLEGLLFPETYIVSAGSPPRRLLRAMVGQFLEQGWPVLKARARRAGLSPYQALVLASIIEKESGLASERRLISAVFHNRLKKRMRLQSDPTVIYGIPHFDGNITRKHLRTRTPYNTYRISGLPPTPIASAGLGSIQAAVHPARSAYLFFVGRGDGSHQFSKTLKAHNRAVYRYQIHPRRNRTTRKKASLH